MLLYFTVEGTTADAQFFGYEREVAVVLGYASSDGRTFHGSKRSLTHNPSSLTPGPSRRGEGSRYSCRIVLFHYMSFICWGLNYLLPSP